MNLFFIVLAVFALAMLAMGSGVILSKRRLRGSCGGLAGLKDEIGQSMCEVCSDPSESCGGADDPPHVGR